MRNCLKIACLLLALSCLTTAYALIYRLGMRTHCEIFSVALIISVILFQEDIRLGLERISIWVLSGAILESSSTRDGIEILVQSLYDLARKRVGALVVLRGFDPLERHLVGGWSLDGEMSEALIKSIFDSHALGHDGAFIIEQGRVTRFGVQLPLSKNLRQITYLGTRHSAALGLSEKSDALCIVVSEEKGTISIARHGAIKEIEDLVELRAAIDSFLNKPAQWNIEWRNAWPEKIGQLIVH